MGLDMYLFRKNPKYDTFGEALKADDYGKSEDDCPLQELMYWRKAFDMHRWFEENCERLLFDEKDPLSQYYPVSKAILVELHDYAEKIIGGGVYVYREGEGKRERINLNPEIYRQQLDEFDVNFEKDVVEARLDSSIADGELWHLFYTFDRLEEILPTVGDDETLYYYPSY